LLTVLPWLPADGDAGDVRSEMRSRLGNGLVSERDCLRMLEMVRDGDATAPIGSDAWQQTYGGWLDALRNRWSTAESNDPLRLAATTLPPLMEMDLPSTWPTDQSLVAVNRVGEWWPEGVQVRMRVTGVDGIPMQAEALEDLRACEWTRSERRGFGGGFGGSSGGGLFGGAPASPAPQSGFGNGGGMFGGANTNSQPQGGFGGGTNAFGGGSGGGFGGSGGGFGA
jgi:hypothetical protein